MCMHVRVHHDRLSYQVICRCHLLFRYFRHINPFPPGHTPFSKPMNMKTLQGESASAFCHWFGDPSSLFVFVAWWLLAAQVDEGIAGSGHRLPLALGGSRSCSSDDGSTGDESGIEQISSQTCGCTTGGIQLCLWFARQKSGKDGSAEGVKVVWCCLSSWVWGGKPHQFNIWENVMQFNIYWAWAVQSSNTHGSSRESTSIFFPGLWFLD